MKLRPALPEALLCVMVSCQGKEGGLGYTLHMVKMGHSSIAITADTNGRLLPSKTDTEEFDAAARQLLG